MRILLITLIIAISYSCKEESMKILPFEEANTYFENDSGQLTNVYLNYLVKDWKNNITNELKLDSLVCSNISESTLSYETYYISFYRLTNSVNSSNFIQDRSDCMNKMGNQCIINYSLHQKIVTKYRGYHSKSLLRKEVPFKCSKTLN